MKTWMSTVAWPLVLQAVVVLTSLVLAVGADWDWE